MRVEIKRLASAEVSGLVSDRRLYLAGDGATLVEDGDPQAAVLLATPGDVVPSRRAKELRLAVVGGRLVQQPEGATVLVGESAEVAPKAEKPKRKRES